MRKFKTERMAGGIVKEWFSDETGKITIRTQQDTRGIQQGVRDYSELSDTKDMKYDGSVPMLIAQKWAEECGASVLSPEWKEYAMKQYKKPQYAYLRASQRRRYFNGFGHLHN